MKRKRHSIVLEYFEKTADRELICKVCHGKMKGFANTGNLKRHLVVSHPQVYTDPSALPTSGYVMKPNVLSAKNAVCENVINTISPTSLREAKPSVSESSKNSGSRHASVAVEECFLENGKTSHINGQLCYFVQSSTDTSLIICNLCGVSLTRRFGNSNLLRHLRRKHADVCVPSILESAPQVMVMADNEIQLESVNASLVKASDAACLMKHDLGGEASAGDAVTVDGTATTPRKANMSVYMVRPRANTSKVWQHFVRSSEDRTVAVCIHCQKRHNCFDGTTGNLLKHLRTKHKNKYETCTAEQRVAAAVKMEDNSNTAEPLDGDLLSESDDDSSATLGGLALASGTAIAMDGLLLDVDSHINAVDGQSVCSDDAAVITDGLPVDIEPNGVSGDSNVITAESISGAEEHLNPSNGAKTCCTTELQHARMDDDQIRTCEEQTLVDEHFTGLVIQALETLCDTGIPGMQLVRISGSLTFTSANADKIVVRIDRPVPSLCDMNLDCTDDQSSSATETTEVPKPVSKLCVDKHVEPGNCIVRRSTRSIKPSKRYEHHVQYQSGFLKKTDNHLSNIPQVTTVQDLKDSDVKQSIDDENDVVVNDSTAKNVSNTVNNGLRSASQKKRRNCGVRIKPYREFVRELLHVDTTSKRYYCNFCEVSYATQPEAIDHAIIEHQNRQFTCKLCRKHFSTRLGLRTHHKSDHVYDDYMDDKDSSGGPPNMTYDGNDSVTRPSIAEENGGTANVMFSDATLCHVCKLCGRGFSSLIGAEEHIQLKHTGKPNVCCVCNVQYSCCAALRKHMEVKHPGVPGPVRRKSGRPKRWQARPVCDTCGETLATAKSLYYHCYKLHQACQCDECGQDFAGRLALICHVRIEHPNVPPPHMAAVIYTCDRCSATFDQPARLIDHQAAHHFGQVYVCDVCGRKLRNRETLAVHKRIHDASKQRLCPDCGKRFVQLSHLRDHQRVHHSQSLPSNVHREFKCNQCGCSYWRSGQLRKHMRQVHNILEPSVNRWSRKTSLITLLQDNTAANRTVNAGDIKASSIVDVNQLQVVTVLSASDVVLAQDTEYKYVCVTCGFSSDNEAEMSEHLRTATTNGCIVR